MAVSLKDALECIQSNKIQDRVHGLADLKHVLKHNRNAPELRKLKDKAYHSMFEDLFRVVTKEKATYLKAVKSSLKSIPDSRLVACADALRFCVQSLVQCFRSKTLKAIVGHIVQTLPASDGTYCQPLCIPYLKALATILGYPPHTEHLSRDGWLEAVDFCLEGIKSSHSDFETQPGSLADSGNSRNRTRDSGRGSSFTQGSQSRLHRSADWKARTEAFFECLTYLVTASNCPILERGKPILHTIFDFLTSATSTTGAINSYQIINCVLSRISLESGQDTRDALRSILPLIKSFWPYKEPELRDEMLKSLLILRPYLSGVGQLQEDDEFADEISGLLDAMMDDYLTEGRKRRHLLLADLDLDLHQSTSLQIMPLRNRTTALRCSTLDAEHNWTLLHFISVFAMLVDDQYSPLQDQTMDIGQDAPRKRRRLNSKFQDMLHESSRAPLSLRVYWTQILSTISNSRVLPLDRLQLLVDLLLQFIGNRSPEVSTWALLGIAGCASQESAKEASLHDLWLSVWHSIFRLISSVSHSRAACHALTILIHENRIEYSSITESLESFLDDGGLSSPTALSDAAIGLWIEIINAFEASGTGDASSRCADRMITWITRKWAPSNFVDWSYALQAAQSVSVDTIIRAIARFYAPNGRHQRTVFPKLLPIGQTWLEQYFTRDLLSYLLLQESSNLEAMVPMELRDMRSPHMVAFGPQNQPSRDRLVEYLLSEQEKALANWDAANDRHTKATTSESIQLMISLILVCDAINLHALEIKSGRLQTMRKRNESLTKCIVDHLSRSEMTSAISQAVLEILGRTFSAIPTSGEHSGHPNQAFPSGSVCSSFAGAVELRKRADAMENEDDDFNADEMDVDIDSQAMAKTRREPFNRRHDSTILADFDSHYACVSSLLTLMPALYTSSHGQMSLEISSDFAGYLLLLPINDLLSVRPLLIALEHSGHCFIPSDAESLLEHLAWELLPSYEHERCEVSMQACIQLMRMTVSLWTDPSNSGLADIAGQVYDWLIDVVFGKDLSSPTVQIGLSDLLFRLLEVKPDYVSGGSSPSVRTSLLRILKQGQLPVQYRIASGIPSLFSMFVLNQHNLIFEDIQNSLPYDVEWIEGLAIRLLVLAKLAEAWKTLLRRCVYHIFETAGLLPATSRHAAFCLETVANTSGLEQPKELYKLFSPQLVHTWLNAHPIQSIPFRIFGYSTLAALLKDSQAELTSQLVVKGDEKGLQEVANQLNQTPSDLVSMSFSQVAAFGFASDACTTVSENVPPAPIEHRIRDIFGKTAYISLITERLPVIIAYLFKRLDQEESFEKAFARRKGYDQAARVFKKIRDADDSDEFVPSSQQPSFKSKYLLEEIERLCRRANKDPSKFWTQSTVRTVARMILDDIHPVLGSLHVRKTIRRLRILVSLSGQAAVQDYALELLLHALRPWLTDKTCARDAIGLYKYLLEAGDDHLSRIPSFVAGSCLAIHLEMRNLLQSTQDSTTQESEHRTTLSKAQGFRDWLGQWLDSYKAPTFHASAQKSFTSLMRTAALVTRDGSAESHAPEGRLLGLILSDMKASRKALSVNAADACLRLLCNEQFRVPSSFREDILGVDETASNQAAQIWQSCRGTGTAESYLHWAARALGRSFSYAGQIPTAIATESTFTALKERCAVHNDLLPSKAAILLVALQRLQSEDGEVISLAESSIQRILCVTRDTEEGHLVQDFLPPNVTVALFPDVGVNPLAGAVSETREAHSLRDCFVSLKSKPAQTWLYDILSALLAEMRDDPFLREVESSLKLSREICQQIFPYVLHCALHFNRLGQKTLDDTVSEGFRNVFEQADASIVTHVTYLLDTLLYLRTQPLPKETAKFDRNTWLSIDYEVAATAAKSCRMFKTALLLVEIGRTLQPYTSATSSRRSSTRQIFRPSPDNLLLSIYQDIDEPDSFHGVVQAPSLESVASRLAFEGSGVKELLLRGAQNDGAIRCGLGQTSDSFSEVVNSLGRINMSGLTTQLMGSQLPDNFNFSVADSIAKSALKLRQWDIPAPQVASSNMSSVFSTLQSVNQCNTLQQLSESLNAGILSVFRRMNEPDCAGQLLRSSFASLAALTDADEILSSRNSTDLEDVCSRLEKRQQWMLSSRLDDVSQILSIRESVVGLVCDNEGIRDLLGVDLPSARLLDVRTNLQSSAIFRAHGSLQESLNNVTYLSNILGACEILGLEVTAAVKQEMAQVLWDSDELIPSIRILQSVESSKTLDKQTLPVNRAGVLATLGHYVSEARSEKPVDVLNNYLTRAWKELKRTENSKGRDAGCVYHEYAKYCHGQLTSPENAEEFRRSERFTAKRLAEVRELDRLLGTKLTDNEKHRAKSDRNKSRKWFEIDKAENERLITARNQFLRQALEAYLLSLTASNDHDTDILRFLALWLEHAANPMASEAVSKNIENVPSLKFAALMNQMASRLQDSDDRFQREMSVLVERICIQHPFHGMYHIYAGSNTQGGNDRTANSRNAAAKKVAHRLSSNQKTSNLWKSMCRANDLYLALASHRSEAFKPGHKIALRNHKSSKVVESEVKTLGVPPITMEIALRADCDYTDVPTVAGFRPDMSIAGGLSAPKILTAVATNGKQCKQLFKAGADDLRQDAIMEQVFEQVSSLLKSEKSTRQRNLHIRTYKVVPLDATSGAIEFVQSTMPLNDYLRSAHPRYQPKDLKWDVCRNKVEEVRTRSLETRVKVYRSITDNFNPVLRHFFFERFEDPDDWFERRLAYTRSTAAISILGHALGLGDRHCQNILLDTSTGEVVHIDLGVAFEAGRILAVPEVVPFRLTRDIVDGFGIMGTEGVFRRCCEFTLEALRLNRDAVMTLLNVLRYDPLYSWSMSPLRAKRLQEEQDREVSDATTAAAQSTAAGRSGMYGEDGAKSAAEPVAAPKVDDDERDDEGGEADRALSVVERKLAPGLSVMAAVNELIQIATDEKNLAVLFCGWAAYA